MFTKLPWLRSPNCVVGDSTHTQAIPLALLTMKKRNAWVSLFLCVVFFCFFNSIGMGIRARDLSGRRGSANNLKHFSASKAWVFEIRMRDKSCCGNMVWTLRYESLLKKWSCYRFWETPRWWSKPVYVSLFVCLFVCPFFFLLRLFFFQNLWTGKNRQQI